MKMVRYHCREKDVVCEKDHYIVKSIIGYAWQPGMTRSTLHVEEAKFQWSEKKRWRSVEGNRNLMWSKEKKIRRKSAVKSSGWKAMMAFLSHRKFVEEGSERILKGVLPWMYNPCNKILHNVKLENGLSYFYICLQIVFKKVSESGREKTIVSGEGNYTFWV